MPIGAQRSEKDRNYHFSKDVAQIQLFWLIVGLVTMALSVIVTVLTFEIADISNSSLNYSTTLLLDAYYNLHVPGLHGVPPEVTNQGIVNGIGAATDVVPIAMFFVFLIRNMRKHRLTALLDLRYDDWASRKGLVLIFSIYGVFAALGIVQIIVLYIEQFDFTETGLTIAAVVLWALIEIAMVVLDLVASVFVQKQSGKNLVWTEETTIRHKFLFQNFIYILGRGLHFSMISWAVVSRADSEFLSLTLIVIWFGIKILRHIGRLVRFYTAVKLQTSGKLSGFRKFVGRIFLYTTWSGNFEQQYGPASVVVQGVTDFLFVSRLSTVGVVFAVFDMSYGLIWAKVSAKKQHIKEPPGWPLVLVHDLFVILNFSVLMIYSALETPGWLVLSFFFVLFVLIFKIPGPWTAINITLAFGVVSHIILFVLYTIDDRNPQPYFSGSINDNIIFVCQFIVWCASVLILALVSLVPQLRRSVLKIVEKEKADLEQLERAHAGRARDLSEEEEEDEEEEDEPEEDEDEDEDDENDDKKKKGAREESVEYSSSSDSS